MEDSILFLLRVLTIESGCIAGVLIVILIVISLKHKDLI